MTLTNHLLKIKSTHHFKHQTRCLTKWNKTKWKSNKITLEKRNDKLQTTWWHVRYTYLIKSWSGENFRTKHFLCRLTCCRRWPIVYAQLLSPGGLFVTPWPVAHQAPLSIGFSRQEYWSELPFPSRSLIWGTYYERFFIYFYKETDFPGSSVGKNSAYQCRGCGFDP